MSRYLILFVLLLLAAFQGAAQPGNKYYIKRINTENGLPSDGIAGLQWDEKTGFLWIATGAGIVRYNGMDLKIYNKEDEPHLLPERIKFLLKNNAGKIYVVTENSGLFYVQENRLKFREREKPTKDSASINPSLTGSDELFRAKLYFSGNSRSGYSLIGNTPLPMGDTAMFLVHGRRLQYYSLTLRMPIDTLHCAINFSTGFKCDGSLFLVDSSGNIFRYDGRSKIEKLMIAENNSSAKGDLKPIFFIWQNGMRAPLIFNKQKAWILSYKNGKLIVDLICDQVPPDELIQHAQYDEKTRTLFIGTNSRGVIIIGKKRLETVRNEQRKATEPVSYYAQLELPDGNILTNEGQIIGKNKTALGFLPIKGKFSNSLLTADSILWVNQLDPTLGYPCLHSYDYRTAVRKTYPKVRADPQLGMVTVGDQLYLTKQSGIFKLKADSLEAVYIYPKDKGPVSPGVVKEIAPGVLAIASCNAVFRFDISSKKLDTIFTTTRCVRTIWQYKDYIFFGTYGAGAFVYRNGVVKQLPFDKSKYLLYTHCFIKDDNGYCWISTNRGLFKASISDLTEAFENNSTEVYYHYYGRNDGMEMSELNGGCEPCALLKKDRTISFPSMDGLLWLDPLNAQPILPSGDIYIDQVIADKRSIDPDSLSLKKLPVETDEITVRLGISAWTNKENIYIWYKLDNKEWRPIDIEKGLEIRLNNLSYGKYHLYIKKRNGFGADNYSYKELEFQITTPWYRRWWFYLLVIGVIAALFGLYLNLRTRQLKRNHSKLEKLVAEKTKELQQKNEVLEKNDTIKTRLISIISHDIITPLKFVTAAAKKLIEIRKQMPEKQQDETLTEMANTSQDLQLLSMNILNWIKYQNEHRRLARERFNLRELVAQSTGILRSIAKQKQNELLNNVDEQIFIYEYLEPLKIIIYNLVSNAINFTEKGKIIIDGKMESGTVIITVSDDGVGMSPEQIQNIMAGQFIISSVNVDNKKGNGLGYLIIKDLLQMMGGTFMIQSEKGKGTTVSILLTPP